MSGTRVILGGCGGIGRALVDAAGQVGWTPLVPDLKGLRAPFGGFKSSGVGREGGDACEAFYTEEKTTPTPIQPVQQRRFGVEG